MKELSLNEVKRIELEILVRFDSFCRNNKLRYSLAYGSLIGAIRHKGFIPWDDDIDIWMPRPDYDVLVSTFNDNRFILLCHEKCEYWQEFGKITDSRTLAIPTNNKGMGVFVDVFPIDGLPPKSEQFKKKILWLYNIYKRMRRVNVWKIDNSISSVLYKIMELFYPTRKLFDKFEEKKKSYSFLHSETSWDLYIQFESSDFDKVIDLEFEGEKFHCLENYDKYLRMYYGEYMTYPPVEKRVSGHNYKYYVVD